MRGQPEAVSQPPRIAEARLRPKKGYRPRPSRVPERETVGLVAGWGRFPVLVAEALVKSRRRVVCVALRGLADPHLEYLCDHVKWMGVARLGGHLRYFEKQRAHSVTMAGKLFKAELLFERASVFALWPDWTCVRTLAPHFVFRRRDTRDDSLLTAVTDAYLRRGMPVRPATNFAPELLIDEGVLTRRTPRAAEQRDIAFGWEIAKQMGALDIGQSITVREGTVLAVEAVEGTDQCIARTGALCPRGGWTLVKVAKPDQDMRFDVPTIGPQTVERVSHAGGRAIAVEANRTIILDAEETTRKADQLGIAIVALADSQADNNEKASRSAA